ncbi:hypothetical protein [Streptococcus suis]|uniref:hypothetical protein n=1 Tax=Streptococcus suis TaxID=1307 RepID=UPI00300FE7F9
MSIYEEVEQYQSMNFSDCYRDEYRVSEFHDLTLQEKHDLYCMANHAMEQGKSLIDAFAQVFVMGRIAGIRAERSN